MYRNKTITSVVEVRIVNSTVFSYFSKDLDLGMLELFDIHKIIQIKSNISGNLPRYSQL